MQQHPHLDLIIVGAQKSFTTSLKTYLGEHPSVITHPQQEMAYFTDDKEYALGCKKALSHYYKDLKYHKGKKTIAKNAILYVSEESVKRLHEHFPDCKLVLILRNPIDRAYSAYLMEYNFADVGFPFKEVRNIAEKADESYWPFRLFIDAGNYAKHLKVIYKYFPKEQVKVILCEEILEDPLKTCGEIFRWLGVDDTFTPEIKIYNSTQKRVSKLYARFAVNLLKKNHLLRKLGGLIMPAYYNYKLGDFIRNLNKTNNKYEEMDAHTREYLLNYYSNANKELEELIGKKVTQLWNK
jgi:hypothetical protein